MAVGGLAGVAVTALAVLPRSTRTLSRLERVPLPRQSVESPVHLTTGCL
jgi:hypothetical protein